MALTTTEKAALLGTVELFTGVEPDALASIAERTQELELPAGRPIVHQGEIGTGFFLITSGRARVVRDDELLARLGPGDFFGELSLLDQQPRSAQVVADEPTTCLALASWDFDAVLRSRPDVAIALLRGLARRLRVADAQHRH